MGTIRDLGLMVGLLAGTAALLASGCGSEGPKDLEGSLGGSLRSQSLTAEEVLPTGPTCTPNGAHGKHAAVADCKACHVCGGVLQFDPVGPAVAPGKPLPTFDAATKTCSNVACHGVPSGTFTYYFPGGDGEPEAKTVGYGGLVAVTPSWYSQGTSCGACHGNPPADANGWHSGYHGNQTPAGALNQCQLCHPDATSTNGHASSLLPVPPAAPSPLHRNGVVNVQASFKSSCFGCH